MFFLNGLVFSIPLMTILFVHEMGHYMAGRRRGLNVTLPYFIPSIPPLGTFGAFIKVRSFIPNKKILMELGAWGPLSGAAVGIPLLFLGLWFSEVHPQTSGPEVGISFGTSLILEIGCLIRFGEFSFNNMIILHPTAMAAWFGLFVTAMNLLPMGQLDGGHVIYSLFGSRVSRIITFSVFGGSGNGEQIAANKVRGIRAALVWSIATAELAREHNDANVISIGARQHIVDEAIAFIDRFIATPFSGEERHARRIAQLAAFETDGTLVPDPRAGTSAPAGGESVDAMDPEAG